MALLEGSTSSLTAARARVAAGRPLPGALLTAGEGVADLLVRFAQDLAGPEVPELAIRFAQLASFFDPRSADARIMTGRLLAERGQHRAALSVLAQVSTEDPLAPRAANSKTASLVALGRGEEAVAAAAAGAASAEGAARLGDVLTDLERHGEAADAYRRALELTRAATSSARAEWTLALQLGSALLASGRWPEAKAALQEARRLAPDEAMVLNFLGYAQLERREDLPEAARLIEEASRLAPDDASITDSLGWSHFLRGNTRKAIELLEKAAQAVPADPAVNEHLGDAYYVAGRRFEARFAWQAALTFAQGDVAERLRAKIVAGLTPGLAAP
jgi:tetratricopeptide (TPR) repeat protein